MSKSIGLPFVARLVPKVLDGSKTQTRRLPGIHNCRLLTVVATPGEEKDVTGRMKGLDWDSVKALQFNGYKESRLVVSQKMFLLYHPEDDEYYELVPRHEPGDIAWMREIARRAKSGSAALQFAGIEYKADGATMPLPDGVYSPKPYKWERWSPSIHMPRWASRWERPLKSVRIELIQDISPDDACAEGIPNSQTHLGPSRARMCFKDLWDTINVSRGWAWELNRPVVVFDWKE